MTDNLTSKNRQKAMRAVKSKNTSIERRLWGVLAGKGISGWRKNAREVLGCPDVVFDDRKIAIFVDGCFWHGCTKCNKILPANNHEYWAEKIRKNRKRATKVNRSLLAKGWIIYRIWEHEFKNRKDLNLKIKLLVSNVKY